MTAYDPKDPRWNKIIRTIGDTYYIEERISPIVKESRVLETIEIGIGDVYFNCAANSTWKELFFY